jgi:hypothetical protein
MPRLNIVIDTETPDGMYFDSCARIRNISLSSLVRRLLDMIAEDQMVASILDDGDAILQRRRSEHSYRTPRLSGPER